MHKIILLSLAVQLTAVAARAQECPQTAAAQRRVAEEAIGLPAARQAVREGRTRVLHVYCAERDKDSRRTTLVAVVYNYSANVAFRLALDPASREMLASERLAGRPQSSAEEREEAFRLVRDKLDLGANVPLEGGFVTDPPEGAPPAGRYLTVQVLGPDRWKLIEVISVDLARGVIAGRRRP